MEFLPDAEELTLNITGELIRNDTINEGTEAFLMVLEIESPDPAVGLLEGRDVLLFNIIDDDSELPITHLIPHTLEMTKHYCTHSIVKSPALYHLYLIWYAMTYSLRYSVGV